MLVNEGWEAHLSERGSHHQKVSWRLRPADYPVVYLPAALLQLPQIAAALPPCFQDHPSPDSPVPALSFLLLLKGIVLLENIFCCFSLILPSYHSSFEEQNVISGLHLYWVRSQPPPPLLVFFRPSNRIPEALGSLPSFAGFVPAIPPPTHTHIPGDFLQP